MANEKNYTKRSMYEALKAAAVDGNLHIEDFDAEISDADVVEFCDNELAALDKKAAKAKETLAKKRAIGDELTDAVRAVLTTDPQTVVEITEQIQGEDVTQGKVQFRLNTLYKNGEADKVEVIIPGVDGAKPTKRVAYMKANA